MTVDDAIHAVAHMTTDGSGYIASYSFRQGGVVGHAQAVLDTSDGDSPAVWKVLWTVHWRTAKGQEQRETSTDLHTLLARFGHLDLENTKATSLDQLLKQ